MYSRSIKPLKTNSFFLFGARGTGKTTFLKDFFFRGQNYHSINLLLPEVEDRYAREPELFRSDIEALGSDCKWILVDEVQKNPRLLDLVHHLIESGSKKFALTGSSARKLKRGSANLLAGRAYVHHLFPFTSFELGKDFNLERSLNWGSLPHVATAATTEECAAYLRSYALTYIKEEVQMEQLVRNLDPFREFLEIAALGSGEIINYSKIGRDVGVDNKTVQNYFQILEDTLLGFILPAHHDSLRKAQLEHPKFYLFDNGVRKALARSLQSYTTEGTSAYGEAFEHWIIQEIFRLNHYTQSDYRLSYFATKNGAEIDLILSRARKRYLLEIKSSKHHDLHEMRKLDRISKDLKADAVYYISRDEHSLKEGNVEAMHWQKFLSMFFDVSLT